MEKETVRAIARKAAAEVVRDNLAAIIEEDWKAEDLYGEGFEQEYCFDLLLDKMPDSDGMTEAEQEACLARVFASAKRQLPALLKSAKAEHTAWLKDFGRRLQTFGETGELPRAEDSADVSKLSQKIAGLEREITRLREETGQAQNIDGWTVAHDGKYYRLHKSINGRGHSIHVGKELDIARAKVKIREKMKKIGQPNM